MVSADRPGLRILGAPVVSGGGALRMALGVIASCGCAVFGV